MNYLRGLDLFELEWEGILLLDGIKRKIYFGDRCWSIGKNLNLIINVEN